MIKVHEWNEVLGEVIKVEMDLPTDATARQVMAKWHELADTHPGEMEESWRSINLGDTTLVVGLWGRDKEFMMWWGTQTRAITEIVEDRW